MHVYKKHVDSPGVIFIIFVNISTLHNAKSGQGPFSFCVTIGTNPPCQGIHFN